MVISWVDEVVTSRCIAAGNVVYVSRRSSLPRLSQLQALDNRSFRLPVIVTLIRMPP